MKEFNVTVSHDAISKSDYLKLVEDVGWKRYVNADSVEAALSNTLWSTSAIDPESNEIIGYVRIVGDGAIFFYLQDLMVLKKYRKKGIGRVLMESAEKYLRSNAPKKSSIGLFTHSNKRAFYEKFSYNGPRPSLVECTKTNA